jgi:AraC-like DNA-binding protein
MEDLQVEEGWFALLEQLFSALPVTPPRATRAVERTREYLAEHACQHEALAQIAAAVHCSPFHLARAFRRQTGRTIHAYRTGLRMVHALDRLQQGERDLAALSADLGYSSHSHFSQVFRGFAGTSPNQIRTKLTAAAVPK